MAITTLAGVRSGLQPPVHCVKQALGAPTSGVWMSYWNVGGNPIAGSYDTTLNGVTLTAPQTGQIDFKNPTSGAAYLARLETTARNNSGGAFAANVMLIDRLWHNGNIDVTSTSPQAITSPTWPARDENGATSGAGVVLALIVSATVGAATPTITVGYTNSAGASGKTGTNIFSAASGSITGSTYIISIESGDVGVQSVQSLTLSASWISGTINLVAFRPLAMLPSDSFGRVTALDAITGAMPRIYDGSVLDLWILGANNQIQSPFATATYAYG